MPRAYKDDDNSPISEMAIVDTITKLIFGEEDDYDAQELTIIQALRNADANVVFDSHRDMGVYLRALGVAEMIQLVGRVRTLFQTGVGVAPLEKVLAGKMAGLGRD